ncbi:hypothetical protein L1887_02279 [Cichorium endivia]|nr:hypothetical protein L1887_02279 [Cichorium endivia]
MGLENSISFQFFVLDCDLKHCTLLPILKIPFGWEVDILDYDWKSLCESSNFDPLGINSDKLSGLNSASDSVLGLFSERFDSNSTAIEDTSIDFGDFLKGRSEHAKRKEMKKREWKEKEKDLKLCIKETIHQRPSLPQPPYFSSLCLTATIDDDHHLPPPNSKKIIYL